MPHFAKNGWKLWTKENKILFIISKIVKSVKNNDYNKKKVKKIKIQKY